MEDEYVLDETQLEALAIEYGKSKADFKPGWDKLQETKGKLLLKLEGSGCVWRKYEQGRYLYQYKDQYKFNDRGICASMSLLMFIKCGGKGYPGTVEDLKKLMDDNFESLKEYGIKYDTELRKITVRTDISWDLEAFKIFCSEEGKKEGLKAEVEIKQKDSILLAPEERWDLGNIKEGETYFIGEKAKLNDTQSAHVVLLGRIEGSWYLFDPTVGVFISSNKDTIKEVLVIKTQARLEKVAGTNDISTVEGYTAYMLVSL